MQPSTSFAGPFPVEFNVKHVLSLPNTCPSTHDIYVDAIFQHGWMGAVKEWHYVHP